MLTAHLSFVGIGFMAKQGRRHRGGGAAGAAAPPQSPAGPLFTEFAVTRVWKQEVMVILCT